MALSAEARQRLVEAAAKARQNAYAPYSRYKVGAALLAKNGQVFTGVNVENAAYPTTICAERVAVFTAITAGQTQFEAIAVVTSNAGAPCGSCRQVLAEFGTGILVILADTDGNVAFEGTVSSLLPGAFGPEDLPPAN